MMAYPCERPHVMHCPYKLFTHLVQTSYALYSEKSLIDPVKTDYVGLDYPRVLVYADGEISCGDQEQIVAFEAE